MRNTIYDLKNHLFDVIERLKSAADPDADPKDTITLETAKAITDCAKVIVDAAKTEVAALSILAKADNPDNTKKAAIGSGILSEGNAKLIMSNKSEDE